MPDLQRAIVVYSGPQQTTAIDYSDPAETDWTRTELANAANAGESASSTWVVRDEAGRIPDYRANNNKFLSSHNYTIATVGSNTLWRGRIEAQDVKRGVQVGTRPHEFTQTMSDANSHLRGIVVHNWERPSETDAARVQALVAAYLSGNPRVTTNLNGSNFVITGSNTTTLKPRTYTAQSPAEILAHMAEVFDKEMFVDVDNNLHYHGHDYNGFDSPFRISDDINDLNSTTCLTIEPRASEESTNQLTSVRLYWGADEEQRSVVVNDTPSRTTDYWQEAVFDSEAESTAEATEVAQGILDARRLDQVSYQVRIGKPGTIQAGNGTPMTGDDIQHVKAGQRIYFKSRAARSGIGANGSFTGDSFQLVRIREVRWTMPTPDAYWCDLTLERPLIPKKRRGRTAPRSSVPKPAPEVEPQPEDTITAIAHWQWNAAHGTLDDTDTYDSNITRHASSHSWTGPPAGSITADHGDCGNSGEIFDAVPVTAGTTVSVTIGKFRWKWGPHPLFVNFYSTTDGTGVAIETWTFESGSGKSTNVLYTNIGGTHVAPVGTQSARIQFSSGLGLSVVDDVTIGTIDPADEVVNDPHAVPYGDCPHDSPHFLPSDYVECRLGQLADQVSALQTGLPWVNVLDHDADPSGTADSWQAFDDALETATERSAAIIVPPGVYRMSAPLVLGNSTVIFGIGANMEEQDPGGGGALLTYHPQSVLYFDNDTDGIIAPDDAAVTYRCHHPIIENITVRGGGAAQGNRGIWFRDNVSSAVSIQRVGLGEIRNCFLEYWDKAIDFDGTADSCKVIGGHIHDCDEGFIGGVSEDVFERVCVWSLGVGPAVSLSGDRGQVTGCEIEPIVGSGIVLTSTASFNRIIGNDVKDIPGTAINVAGSDNTIVGNTASRSVTTYYADTGTDNQWVANTPVDEFPTIASDHDAEDHSIVGHYELLMTGTSPPEPLEDGTGSDWLYVWVS